MKRIVRICLAACLVTAACGLSACGKTPTAKATPKVETPAIAQAGVLRVGVTPDSMPYADKEGTTFKGLDVDVASFVAQELGLKVQFVAVSKDANAYALDEGTIDAMMSVSMDEVSPTTLALAGSYAQMAPVIFVKAGNEKKYTAQDLASSGARVGTDAGSSASWTLDQMGVKGVVSYEDLDKAFSALAKGDLDAVVCDSVAGAYLCNFYDNISYADQLGNAVSVGIGVKPDNEVLQTKIQEVLDTASADGRLKLISASWIGVLPELKVDSSVDTTSAAGSYETSGSVQTTTPIDPSVKPGDPNWIP